MVLSSNAVAETSSGAVGLEPGALLDYGVVGGRARFTINPLPGAKSAQFQWRLNRAILESQGKKTFTLSDRNGVVMQTVDIKGRACGPPCSGYVGPSADLQTMVIDRNPNVTSGDFLEVDVIAIWTLKSGTVVRREYRIYGNFGSAMTVMTL